MPLKLLQVATQGRRLDPPDDSSYSIDDAEDDGYPSRGRPIGASTRRVIITILQ